MKKLAFTQIILGMLVVGSLIYWMGWLSTGYFHYVGTDPDGNIILGVLGLHKPNPFMEVWAVVYPALGLSVLGCGIAQYFKARHQSAGIGDKPGSGDENTVVKVRSWLLPRLFQVYSLSVRWCGLLAGLSLVMARIPSYIRMSK